MKADSQTACQLAIITRDCALGSIREFEMKQESHCADVMQAAIEAMKGGM
jgi:hypothetical protein